jgi:hypothetical protein
MKKPLALFWVFATSVSSFAQYCMNAGPTNTQDSNVQLVQITGASGNINFTGCPGVLGVQDLTGSQSVTLNAGSSYQLTVDFGTCQGNYAGVGQVFIDFNQNAIFEPTESVGTWQGTPPVAPSLFNFAVPVNAQSGSTRMRVIQHEGGTLPIDPCAAFTWGSVMDFGIVVSGGIDCSGYDGDTQGDAIPVTSIPFTANGDNSYCYFNQNLVYNSPDIYYRLIPSAQMLEATVSLCGSGFDTFLSVVDPQGNVIAYNDDGSCGSSSELTFSTVGVDTAFIIVEGWGNEQGTFTLTIDGAFLSMDEQQQNSFVIFPNPVKENFRLRGLTESGTGAIRNAEGRIIKENIEITPDSNIDVSNLNAGVYFIEITTTKGTTSHKFLKVK